MPGEARGAVRRESLRILGGQALAGVTGCEVAAKLSGSRQKLGAAPRVPEGLGPHSDGLVQVAAPGCDHREFTPEDAYAVMTKEPGGATSWTF